MSEPSISYKLVLNISWTKIHFRLFSLTKITLTHFFLDQNYLGALIWPIFLGPNSILFYSMANFSLAKITLVHFSLALIMAFFLLGPLFLGPFYLGQHFHLAISTTLEKFWPSLPWPTPLFNHFILDYFFQNAMYQETAAYIISIIDFIAIIKLVTFLRFNKNFLVLTETIARYVS